MVSRPSLHCSHGGDTVDDFAGSSQKFPKLFGDLSEIAAYNRGLLL